MGRGFFCCWKERFTLACMRICLPILCFFLCVSFFDIMFNATFSEISCLEAQELLQGDHLSSSSSVQLQVLVINTYYFSLGFYCCP